MQSFFMTICILKRCISLKLELGYYLFKKNYIVKSSNTRVVLTKNYNSYYT